ncbi:MAG: GNAT family N-acetyltransferase [Thiotrichales bacterium]|nr:MAG: GNAT family N-acetyltransferase [Thiotrichales bacterium]
MIPPAYKDTFEVAASTVTIRTMEPADREIEQRFVRELSPQSRYYRFHSALKELTPYMLERFTHVNYPDEMALIATVAEGDDEQQIGVARYIRKPGSDTAEIAVVVADAWQGLGIGSRLLMDLRQLAIKAGIRRIEMSVLPANRRMLDLARELGFALKEMKLMDYSTIELGKEFEDGKH